MNRRESNDNNTHLNLLDPEIKKYVKLTLYSMPNVLRSYSDEAYN